ncbi:MAG: hypothetical protein NXY57DRAFT_1044579 [Lentinula lateritia]|nr:MAG: hypothetical protein NXY57DRAFT_1044579 [Lentinula lateritia]
MFARGVPSARHCFTSLWGFVPGIGGDWSKQLEMEECIQLTIQIISFETVRTNVRRTQVSCKSLSLMLSTVANNAIPTKVTSKTLHHSIPLIENVPLMLLMLFNGASLYNSGVEDSQVKSQTWVLSIYQHVGRSVLVDTASSNAQLLQSDNFEGRKGSLDSVAGRGEHPQSRDAAAIMVHSDLSLCKLKLVSMI